MVPMVVFGAHVAGGISDLDLKDPRVTDVHEYVTKTNMPTKTLMKLMGATTQVVAGTKTTLKYSIKEGGTCEVSVWDRPWLNLREITMSTCGHAITKTKTKSKRGVATIGKPDNDHLGMFHDFMHKHNKVYKTKAEYKKRFHVFKSNLKTIKLMSDMETGTAKYGVNEFADLSPKEFKLRLGLVKPEKVPQLPLAEIPQIDVPDSYDWRHYNVVTPVKNQGSCGSCWAFSVTGNIEGQWAVQRQQLLSLSEQEIVDCDKADDGCGGGYMYTAYDSIVRLGGLESEKDYPYEGENEQCHLDLSSVEVTIEGGVNITSDEAGMVKWLVQNGPISVGLNANVMQFYMGGVSHPFKFFCNPTELDHGVLIVGYGVETSRVLKRTLPYWIIKNSWGKRWGELGYYRLYRGDGSCGINLMASSAVL